MFTPQRILRRISEISYVGDFSLTRMTNSDGETGVVIPLQYTDDHWKAIFNKYDLDGDGKISYRELKAMIRSTDYCHDIPSRVIKNVMKKVDIDENGYLNYAEFLAMIHRKDMQGAFGRIVKKYIDNVVPQRPDNISRDHPDGEYEQQYNCRPIAFAMGTISAIEISAYFYDGKSHSLILPGPAAKLFIYNPHRRFEIWRYFTYMFVHVDLFHLFVNVGVQILLGVPLEMVHKWWRVLIIYLAGVLSGSLMTSITDPKVHLAGASGGVYAILTAHIATIIMNWSQMQYAAVQACIFLFLTLSDVGKAVYNKYIVPTPDHVGYSAHLGGAIAGLLVGINVLRNLEVKRWEKVVWWVSIIFYTCLMTAAILNNIFNEPYYHFDW